MIYRSSQCDSYASGLRSQRFGESFGSLKGTGDGHYNYYLYDGDQLLAELNAEGSIASAYIWGPTGLSMRLGAAFEFDPQGNCVGMDSADGHDATSLFDGYGVPVAVQPGSNGYTGQPLVELGISDPIGYKGQFGCYTDLDTGLVYCQSRYYDPYAGRWITKDPIGAEGGVNVYEYCDNNPVMEADPNGLQSGDGDDDDAFLSPDLDGLVDIIEEFEGRGRVWRRYRENSAREADEAVREFLRGPTFRAMLQEQGAAELFMKSEARKFFEVHHDFTQLATRIALDDLKMDYGLTGEEEGLLEFTNDMKNRTSLVEKVTHRGWHEGNGFVANGGVRGGYYNNFVYTRYTTIRFTVGAKTYTDRIDLLRGLSNELTDYIKLGKNPWRPP